MAAVSPLETLRSLTMPSNGARTRVRVSCWWAATERDLAPASSLWALLRRISESSSAWVDTMPDERSVFWRSNMRVACSSVCWAARVASSAEFRASRIEVSSRRTRMSPFLTASPFSFITCNTTALTSARRSALRSGWTEPVITGPDASALVSMVSMSSGASDSTAGGASLPPLPSLDAVAVAEALAPAFSGSLEDLPQATRAEATARARRVLRNIQFSEKVARGCSTTY